MKITFIANCFPPEIGPAHLELELVTQLAKLGFDVKVVTVFPRKYLLTAPLKRPRWRFFYREWVSGLETTRVQPTFSSKELYSRGIEYFVVGISLFLGGLIAGKSNVIVCSSPPLPAGLAGILLARIKRQAVILRVGDLHPQALLDISTLKKGYLLLLLEMIEHLSYRLADHITVLSEGSKTFLIGRGVKRTKITTVPLWAGEDTLTVSDFHGPDWVRKKLRLPQKFIVTYAGAMSWPQDLQTILDAADILREESSIVFLLVGDGQQKINLQQKVKDRKLENVIFLPLQPRDEYLHILSASDICLASLKKGLRTPTVPSKILDVMSLGRPVVANVPLDGDAARLIEAANCGLVVESGNPKMLSEAILRIKLNHALAEELGKNGEQYALQNLTQKACASKYFGILENLAKREVHDDYQKK